MALLLLRTIDLKVHIYLYIFTSVIYTFSLFPAEGKPVVDVTLGGTNHVNIISVSKDESSTTIAFLRKLITDDKLDEDISVTDANAMIYSWASSDTGEWKKYSPSFPARNHTDTYVCTCSSGNGAAHNYYIVHQLQYPSFI